MRAGACDPCILDKACCGRCWCCPWPRVDAAVKHVIADYRAGGTRAYATGVLRIVTEKAAS